MMHKQLTDGRMLASHRRMDRKFLKAVTATLVIGSATTVSGCVNINAPQEAIVIELNINIQADVVYRLAEDAGDAIDKNADIF